MQWAGAVVLITGGSSGIGAATARAAHDAGAAVGLVARRPGPLREIADELGDRTAIATADVADPDQAAEAVAAVAEQLAGVEILVNNAGLGSYRAFTDEEPETFRHLMDVNYFGTVWTTKAAVAGMVERGRGHVVNVASVAGRIGAPFETAYSASKFAVVGLSEALAAELRPHRIGVSLVCPGPVDTNFTTVRGVDFQRDRPRPLDPARVARAVIAAVEHDRFEQILPRWLAGPAAMRAVVPTLFQRGVARSFAAAVRADDDPPRV